MWHFNRKQPQDYYLEITINNQIEFDAQSPICDTAPTLNWEVITGVRDGPINVSIW